jgi:L-serine deaminase
LASTWLYTWVVERRTVAEELLDRAQVGPAFEQVGREGVAQAVGIRDEAAEGGGVERAPVRGEEDVVVGALASAGRPVLEVQAQAVRGLFPERDGALLPALTEDESASCSKSTDARVRSTASCVRRPAE